MQELQKKIIVRIDRIFFFLPFFRNFRKILMRDFYDNFDFNFAFIYFYYNFYKLF